MLCLRSIASAVLVLGSPPADAVVVGAGGTTAGPGEIAADAAPLHAGAEAGPPASAPWLPADGFAPLNAPVTPGSPPQSDAGSAPLPWSPSPPGAASPPRDALAPLDRADARSDTPLGPQKPAVPRRIDLVRVEVLVGPVWRIRTTEVISLASVEFGRLRGFSGTVQGGVIVAPDRNVVAVADFPLGAGFVYRHRFGRRSLYGSAGLTAGLLIHRAGTDRGVIHRVDPDFQLPLRFAWTPGKVGFTFALLQGFSTRSRTYERRGTEIWHRIPYRIGFAVGIHFDVGVGRPRSRRSDRESKGPA